MCPLVVKRVLGISQIKDDAGVRLSTTTVGELFAEIDSPVEAQATVIVDVDVQRLEVSRSIDDANLASLNEVVGDHEVLLVRGNLDIVRSHGRLVLIGVVQTLDVAQVADIEGGDVVGGGEGQVEEATILADVGAGSRKEGQFMLYAYLIRGDLTY
jgi:hypothetical protein